MGIADPVTLPIAPQPLPNSPTLLDERQICVELRRERVRSVRRGSPLAVLVVHPKAADADEVAEAVRDHAPLSTFDRVGRLRAKTPAILLPERSAWEQAAFAAAVSETLQARDLDCRMVLYSSFEEQRARPRDQANGQAFETRPIGELFQQRQHVHERGFDLVAASTALLVGWPLLVAIGLMVRLTSPGPALFRQERVGLGGRPFRMLKFRTMTRDADAMHAELLARNEQDGPAFKMESDPRVTRLGELLRRTCIDELPQLWNVVRGDMSIVGPRPLPTEEMGGCHAWQRERLDTKPGLTCYWQLTRSMTMPFNDWMRLDIKYTRDHGLPTDVSLIGKTVRNLLLPTQRGSVE